LHRALRHTQLRLAAFFLPTVNGLSESKPLEVTLVIDDKEAIKSLVEVLHDGQKGFWDLAEHLKDPQAKAFFLKESQTRHEYALELETAVGIRRDKEEGGSVAGAVHRFWGDLKGKLGGGDHSLLVTAEQGEDAAKEAYEKALKENEISANLRQIIQKQQAHVIEAHDQVKALRDAKKAA
jgi:uncharacterized protein (TIGR02284 family)